MPSLDAVYDMTWREFHLRRIGFERSEKREWYRTREVGYASLIGGGVDPKKLSKEKYMPLDENQNKYQVTEDGFAALKREQEKYLEQANGSGT